MSVLGVEWLAMAVIMFLNLGDKGVWLPNGLIDRLLLQEITERRLYELTSELGINDLEILAEMQKEYYSSLEALLSAEEAPEVGWN